MASSIAGVPHAAKHALKIFFSARYIYAQIVRRADGHIVAAASTIEKPLAAKLREGHAEGEAASLSDVTAAAFVGTTVGERARKNSVEVIAFEKPRGRPFHGKMAALVRGAISAGLRFK